MKTFAMGAVALLTVTIVIVLSFHEPRYQGRTLTSWLQQCYDTPLMETQRLMEAQDAVRAIGAERALPKLLKLVAAKKDPASTWIIEKSEEWRIEFIRWHSAEDFQQLGIAGFEALRTNAAPAISELTKLLGEDEHAFTAMRCLVFIGPPAEAGVSQALTNKHPEVRRFAAEQFAWMTDDDRVFLARMGERLKDSNTSVRFAVVRGIGEQTQAPAEAIPLLIAALDDGDDRVSSEAVGALSGFGTNAANALPKLSNLVNTGSPAQARSALKALAAIDPVAALPVLSNAVVNGSSATLVAALKNLKTIAPELALEMVLAEFQSTDARRRSQVILAVVDYDVTTPGIAGALKSAAADPDPEIAGRAVMVMKQMLRKQKEAMGGYVQMPDEPVYQGKPLGEWLRMKQPDGWDLSTNAVQALQRMGTNVISALLARLTYKEPVFNLGDFDVSMEAVGGFIFLRDEASPALPALTVLMDGDDQDLVLHAMLATCGMGTNAIPCFIKGLTNRFPDVRNEAANYLTQGVLGTPSPEQREQVTQLFTKLLYDPDENVRMNATNRLKEFDSKVAAKAGIK